MTTVPTPVPTDLPRRRFRVSRKVLPYLWPEDQPWVKRSVVFSMVALILSKIVAVANPFFFKAAVDSLSGQGDLNAGWTLGLAAVGLTVAYGVARLMNVGLQQLRDVFFAVVSELFFERPQALADSHPALYGAFAGYYRVDPLGW